MDRTIMSIANTKQMIEHLKNAPKEIVKGYYFVRIRPDVRDRIIELLIELQKKNTLNEVEHGICEQNLSKL